MPQVPVVRPREVIAILAALGFEEVRQRGSHKRFRHPDGRATTVPVHGSRDLSPILLRRIARDVGLNVTDFVAHRRWPVCCARGRAPISSFALQVAGRRWSVPRALEPRPEVRLVLAFEEGVDERLVRT